MPVFPADDFNVLALHRRPTRPEGDPPLSRARAGLREIDRTALDRDGGVRIL